FPAEPRGLLAPSEKWKDIELATISFGQGVGVTAVQMVSALSAVANGGTNVRPYLVDEVTLPDGKSIDLQHPFTPRRVLSEKTAQIIKNWMEGVVEAEGTGAKAAIPGYSVAGKTGTAQKIDPVTKEYDGRRVVVSFMGFVPSSKPRLAGIFIFNEPSNDLT